MDTRKKQITQAHAFNGYPVEFVKAMLAAYAAQQIPIFLGDMQAGAYLAERQSITITKSTEALFTRNMTAILGTERIDVAVFGCGDRTTPGPIVGMAIQQNGD